MLRTFQKTELIELLNTMLQMHENGVLQQSKTMSELMACQRSAIIIGTTLEQTIENPEHIVSLLEQYCELAYAFSQYPEESNTLDEMVELLQQIKAAISELQVTYQIVFMPYKAAMWDSLESIYLAAREDERCQCLVHPIPYFDFEQRGEEKLATFRYEGDLFPSNIPITYYKDYDMAKEKPDVVYIHNPFDQYNNVTSVHPAFYSEELKKHAGKVVYSPYYVTSGFVSENYFQLPSNNHVDYILAQSKFAKEYYRNYSFYDKVLPFGSPKLDKIVNQSKNTPQIPEEWQGFLQGKKVVMLNTSIVCFLHQGEAYLSKLEYIFQWFLNQEEIALIWRPHPLLESTIHSLRGDLAMKFEKLVQFFKEEQVGIYDTTPEISNTVAIADAYMGEEASSVINLFMMAGKPLFILNNTIYEAFPESWKGTVGVLDWIQGVDKDYVIAGNLICEKNSDWEHLHVVKNMDEKFPYGWRYNGNAVQVGEEIYTTPSFADTMLSYHIKTGATNIVGGNDAGLPIKCVGVVAHNNKVCYLPLGNDALIQYDTVKKEFEVYAKPLLALKGNEWKSVYSEVGAWKLDGDILWLVGAYTNRVVGYRMEDGSYEVYEAGGINSCFCSIEADENYIWLADSSTNQLLRYDKSFKESACYRMPSGWKSWRNSIGRNIPFNLIDMGKYIMLVPVFSNVVVRLEKNSGEMTLMLEEFLTEMEQPHNGYHPKIQSVCRFVKRQDESHILIQKALGNVLAILDVENGTYEEIQPRIMEEDFEELYRDFDGFCKVHPTSDFSCRESILCTMEDFFNRLLKDELQDAMIRQRQEMSNMTDNWDGTAGQQVHEFMMSELVSI